MPSFMASKPVRWISTWSGLQESSPVTYPVYTQRKGFVCMCIYMRVYIQLLRTEESIYRHWAWCLCSGVLAMLSSNPWFHGLAADSKQPPHLCSLSFPSLSKLAFFPVARVVCSKLRADGSHLMSSTTPSSAFEAPGNPWASACLMNPISVHFAILFYPTHSSLSSFLTRCYSLDLKCLPRTRC